VKKIFENGTCRHIKGNCFKAIRGFTLIEVIVVVAIIGIIGVSVVPGILSSLETRDLENSARDIFSTIQRYLFNHPECQISGGQNQIESQGQIFQ